MIQKDTSHAIDHDHIDHLTECARDRSLDVGVWDEGSNHHDIFQYCYTYLSWCVRGHCDKEPIKRTHTDACLPIPTKRYGLSRHISCVKYDRIRCQSCSERHCEMRCEMTIAKFSPPRPLLTSLIVVSSKKRLCTGSLADANGGDTLRPDSDT